jgi:large subunit ribosomal protein LP2
MKYVAAYALLVLGGKAEPSVADIEKVLKEAGIKSDTAKATTVVDLLKGKKLHELISEGKKKMASAGPVAVAAGAPVAAKADVKAAPVKEEKPKEEEADVDMGGLFGDDY